MRFHLIGLVHAQTTDAFPCCAFTSKLKGFCRMMVGLGHEVFLYSGDRNTFPCTAHYPCFTEQDRLAHCGGDYIGASWDETAPACIRFHTEAIEHVRQWRRSVDCVWKL